MRFQWMWVLCTHVCILIEDRSGPGCLRISFWDTVSHVASSVLIWLVWLANEMSQGDLSVSTLPLPSIRIKDLCHYMAFDAGFGAWIWVLIVCRVPTLPVSHLPNSEICFIFQSSIFKCCRGIESLQTYSNQLVCSTETSTNTTVV